jgi:hypothetical protein
MDHQVSQREECWWCKQIQVYQLPMRHVLTDFITSRVTTVLLEHVELRESSIGTTLAELVDLEELRRRPTLSEVRVSIRLRPVSDG